MTTFKFALIFGPNRGLSVPTPNLGLVSLLAGHLILGMCTRQFLTKTVSFWGRFVFDVFQVSNPYKSLGFTLNLKRHSLVFLYDVHCFPNCSLHITYSSSLVNYKSLSEPPSLPTTLPSEVWRESTSSKVGCSASHLQEFLCFWL